MAADLQHIDVLATSDHKFSMNAGRGIVCSARNANLRLAVHFYNDADDIGQLVERIAQV